MNRIAASLEGGEDPSGSSTAALQLLLVSSKLASWVHAPSHASLPSDLQYGPVLLLHRATENADSPHISSRLLDDTLVFLTYGVNYLSGHGDRALSLTRLESFRTQRAIDRANLHTHAQRIQTQFRCQRFGTHRLASLEFATHESLVPEVQERMRLEPPTSSDLTTAAVAVDNEELQVQIEKYATELHARVEARKHAAELQHQRLQKEHREQEDLKKKQFYQKRRRHENACRRWNYFTGRLLRVHRDENHQEIQSRVEARRRTILPTDQQSPTAITRTNTLKRVGSSSRQVMLTTPSAHHAAGAKKNRVKPAFRRTASSTLMKNALHRNFIRQFVAKAIARGLSRVLCESNMGITPRDKAQPAPAQQPEPTKSSDRVLRLGILLCDVHFGPKYMGLYQRFLERAAREKGFAAIEWQNFDCVKSQFPTRALQRVVHGFLVAGGPNNGANQTHVVTGNGNGADADRPDTSESTTSSEDNYRATSKKSAGPWRKNLQKVLRQIYSDKRALLGGLGLGHVVLAEALGAKCDHRDWEDGWSVLDPKLFDLKVLENATSTNNSGSAGRSRSSTSSSRYVGIKYLHGEFVQSMDFAPRGMRSWRSLDQSFISCFKDKWALSFDGFPECGTFVFETMGELYDREKAAAAIAVTQHQQDQRSMALRRASIDEDDTFEPLPSSSRAYGLGVMATQQKPQHPPARRAGVIETVLTLEEKKKLLDVTDISQAVAHALVDHFQAAMVGDIAPALSTATASTAGATEVAAAVNPIDCVDIEESIRLTVAAAVPRDGVTAICLRVRSTLDGHLVVLGAQLDAFVRTHERRVREKRRPSSVLQLHSSFNGFVRKNSSSNAGEDETLLLSLYTLRDQKLVLLDDNASPLSLSSNSKTTVGGKQRTIGHLAIQLPTLNPSSSATATFEGVTVPAPLVNGASSATIDPSQISRKRPPQVVKRVKSSAIGVLTLSEALSRFQSEFVAPASTRANANHTIVGNNNSQRQLQLQTSKAHPPNVIIQFADEEVSGSGSYQLQRKSNAELRQLWVRLVAALRVGEVADDRVSILSRQICVLDFFRKRQPLWTLIKDCRRSAVLAPRHHVKRVSWYARYADTLLFDQEMLLSSSAKENEALFQQARYYGLKVFVAREEKANAAAGDRDSTSNSSTRSLDGSRKRSSKRMASLTQKPQRQSTFSGAGILAKAAADKEREVDKDLQIVEILLLQLTGIDGVLTPTPEIAVEATHKLRSKSPIMNQVEQLFRTWQVKGGSSKSVVVLPKRHSLRNAGNADDQLEEENEDFMGDGALDRDDDCLALDDREIALEMTRQYAEHGVRRPPSSSYVPLRPLQPKRGDQVLGPQQRQRSFPGGTVIGGGESPGTRLRSIGTFRTAFQRSQTVRSPPHLEGTHITQSLDDDRMATRPAESASSLSDMLQVATAQSPRVKRLNQQPSQLHR
ncbi:hypothetical protein Gpo141_00004108 [Globisporangium polare]